MKFLKYLLFTPSITFGILKSEIFPWALIYGLRKFYLNIWSATLIYLMLLSVSWGVFWTNNLDFEIIRSLFAYINCIIIFEAILQKKIDLHLTIKRIFILMVIFGFIQYLGILNGLNQYFKVLIPRGSLSSLSNIGGRGVTLFATEPERAYLNLLFIYAYLKIKMNYNLLLDLIFLVYGVFILKSMTGFIFNILLILLLNPFQNLMYLFPFVGVLINFSIQSSNRILSFLVDLFKHENPFYLIANLSGYRIPSVISGIKFGLNNPFGMGIGQWQLSSMQAFAESGLNPDKLDYFKYYGGGGWIPLRPASFFSNIFLDIGVLGFLIFFVYINLKLVKIKINYFRYPLLFLIYLSFFGAAGDPVPWIVTACIINLQGN